MGNPQRKCFILAMWKLPFHGPSVFRNGYIVTLRSSRSHMFFKMGVLKNFAKFTRKRLPPESPFLIKLQVWGLQLFEKKKLWHRYFSVNFSEHLFYRPPVVATSALCFNIYWTLTHYIAICEVLARKNTFDELGIFANHATGMSIC